MKIFLLACGMVVLASFESGFGASQGKGEESKLEMQYIDVLLEAGAHGIRNEE